VERWFAALTEKQIRRGSHRSTRAVEDAIRLYLATHNAEPKPFVWVKTADDILASIARFALRTSETGHQRLLENSEWRFFGSENRFQDVKNVIYLEGSWSVAAGTRVRA